MHVGGIGGKLSAIGVVEWERHCVRGGLRKTLSAATLGKIMFSMVP